MAHILIVDDSPTIIQLITNMLSEGEHTVIHAMDGEEALKKTETHQPDLVLLDLILPKVSGYQVCREIKSDSTTAHIPVVMITRKSSEKDRKWGVEQGADAYITKPFKSQELLETIDTLLAQAGAVNHE